MCSELQEQRDKADGRIWKVHRPQEVHVGNSVGESITKLAEFVFEGRKHYVALSSAIW